MCVEHRRLRGPFFTRDAATRRVVKAGIFTPIWSPAVNSQSPPVMIRVGVASRFRGSMGAPLFFSIGAHNGTRVTPL
jgi:hypothetical protein